MGSTKILEVMEQASRIPANTLALFCPNRIVEGIRVEAPEASEFSSPGHPEKSSILNSVVRLDPQDFGAPRVADLQLLHHHS